LATGSMKRNRLLLKLQLATPLPSDIELYSPLTHDHRVVDGALGGSFLRRVADLLEEWDGSRTFENEII